MSTRLPGSQQISVPNRFRSILATGLALLVGLAGGRAARAQGYAHPFDNPQIAPEQRIDNILSLMTVQEKINCLGTDTAVPRLGIPSFGGSEGLHGVVQREGKSDAEPVATTQLPQPPGMGETWDAPLIQQAGAVEGRDARFISENPQYNRRILMLWGPQSDLARDPRWGRSEEVYGEDPFFNGTMVVSFIHGLQGSSAQDPDPKYWQAASLLKHFLANSNEDGRVHTSSNFDERLFWEYYSVPFRMGFTEGGARGVMASYNAWNGTPMDINPILKSIVRDQWHVDVLSSDGGAVKNLVTAYKLYPTQELAVVACLKAGINQFLDKWKDETQQALTDKLITEKDIDDVLRYKFRITLKLGLLDPPAMVPYSKVKGQPAPWTQPVDLQVSKRVAEESVVLLKNQDHTLPLDKSSMKSIAVIGPLSNVVKNDWYGGLAPYRMTPLDGIREEVGPNVKVNVPLDDTTAAAVAAAKESDVAVVVVGNDPTCGPNEGREFHSDGSTSPCSVPSDGREGRDRTSIDLGQEELAKAVYAANPKTIMILVSSFPFAINWSQANLPAILHMAHTSQDEGTALAEALFGDINPGGHLTTTWPKSLDQEPPMMDYNILDGRTYMYFKGEPLYPFGYGLSYTTFAMNHLRTSAKTLPKDGTVTVSVDVKNTGSRAGDQVVELYVAHPHSAVAFPHEALKGFARVSLQPGETKTVEVPLRASDLQYWSVANKRLEVEGGPLKLMVGDSSAHLPLSDEIRVQ